MTYTDDQQTRFNTHHPPHWFMDNTWYALTACTFQRLPLLNSQTNKALVRDKLRALIENHHLTLAAWVILDNHYHLLVKFTHAELIPHFIQQFHGSTSHDLNKGDGTPGRRVWQNYWDTCMRNERGYWMRFNYIHHNPIKHRLSMTMAEYTFSSYGYYSRTHGEEWLADAFEHYPIKDYTDSFDLDAVDVS
jgi:putative transposase